MIRNWKAPLAAALLLAVAVGFVPVSVSSTALGTNWHCTQNVVLTSCTAR